MHVVNLYLYCIVSVLQPIFFLTSMCTHPHTHPKPTCTHPHTHPKPTCTHSHMHPKPTCTHPHTHPKPTCTHPHTHPKPTCTRPHTHPKSPPALIVYMRRQSLYRIIPNLLTPVKASSSSYTHRILKHRQRQSMDSVLENIIPLFFFVFAVFFCLQSCSYYDKGHET